MSNKRCKKNKFHKQADDKFMCGKCYQTADKKDKLCKADKNKK
jgi:hypothetical protein